MTCVFVLLTKCRKDEMIKLTPSENLLVMKRRLVSFLNTSSRNLFSDFSGNDTMIIACLRVSCADVDGGAGARGTVPTIRQKWRSAGDSEASHVSDEGRDADQHKLQR